MMGVLRIVNRTADREIALAMRHGDDFVEVVTPRLSATEELARKRPEDWGDDAMPTVRRCDEGETTDPSAAMAVERYDLRDIDYRTLRALIDEHEDMTDDNDADETNEEKIDSVIEETGAEGGLSAGGGTEARDAPTLGDGAFETLVRTMNESGVHDRPVVGVCDDGEAIVPGVEEGRRQRALERYEKRHEGNEQ